MRSTGNGGRGITAHEEGAGRQSAAGTDGGVSHRQRVERNLATLRAGPDVVLDVIARLEIKPLAFPTGVDGHTVLGDSVDLHAQGQVGPQLNLVADQRVEV